jgi:hypothetical protein
MAFSNGQNVQAADLNNFSVTTVTTAGDITCGDDLAVTGDAVITGTLTVGGQLIGVDRDTVCGRLSLTSGSPVTTADVTGATTLYFALYHGNQIALYTGTQWVIAAIAELSIAVPATTAQMYDVFVDYNAGTPQLALTAWTNDTTRATALTKQDGVYVKTGSTGQRYVGSFRTTGVSGQTEDSFTKRYLWNYYHRVPRVLRRLEATNSWSYTTAAWQQANASASNQVEFVIGVAEVAADLLVCGHADNSGGGSHFAVGIGLDTVAAPTTGNVGMKAYSVATGTQTPCTATLKAYPAVGFHYAAWLEYSITNTNTTTWYGDNNTPTLTQSGIHGAIDG